MSDTSWLTDNWPWWVAIYTLLVYEFWALWTQLAAKMGWPGGAHPMPSLTLITLSRMVWRSQIRYPWLDPIALSVLTWLMLHFFVTKGDAVVEWTWTGVIVTVIWMFYIVQTQRQKGSI